MAIQAQSVVVGTRGSVLARTQTGLVVSRIKELFPDIHVSTRVISTEGDRVQNVAVSEFGDKGVFVRGIESALLQGTIDLAVHSLKDIPSDEETPGLHLAAFSAREDPRDVLVSSGGRLLDDLPPGSVVGTSSLRRRVQLRALRDDLHVKDIRGNVDTRLGKMRRGEYDALILAAAGLIRLGFQDAITEYLAVETFTPDAGQGILAIQSRMGGGLETITHALDDTASHRSALAERSCVQALEADCRSPVGVHATVDGLELSALGMAAREDGSRLHRERVRGASTDASRLGHELGIRLLAAFR